MSRRRVDNSHELPAARRQRLVDLVQQQQSMTTLDLAEQLRASSATVRRDLATLEELNLVRRTHGGVVSVAPAPATVDAAAAEYEPAFEEKVRHSRAAKDRIAEVAAELAIEGSTVLIDSGTTALALARRLAGRRITVVALDLKVAEAAAHGSTEVLIAGGRVRPGLFSVVGPWTDAALAHLMVDTFFMGADAISEQGLTNSAVDEARVKVLAIASAKQCVVIADHSKFNNRKMAPVCALDRIDVLVADEATRPLIAAYASKFRRVLYS